MVQSKPTAKRSGRTAPIQPEVEDETVITDVSPVEPGVLVDAEADVAGDSELPKEDRERARKAAESLARRERDHEKISDLALRGFDGPEYEMFASELCAYGYPVIMAWIRRGLIYKLCTEKGRPISASEAERAALNESYEDRLELAMDTTARAMTYFRSEVLLKNKWTFHGGATLTTYFVGACLLAFPNEFRRWQGERARWNKALAVGQLRYPETTAEQLHSPQIAHRLVGHAGSDPADTVVARAYLMAELRAMSEETAQAAALVLDGLSHDEIGAQLGISARAVEALLYRYRVKRVDTKMQFLLLSRREATLNDYDHGPMPGIPTIGAVDRLTEIMTIRNAECPDEERSTAIDDLWMIRSMIVHYGLPETSDGDTSERVLFMLDQLCMLEQTSLGTPGARDSRARASAQCVADIMARHLDGEHYYQIKLRKGRHRAPAYGESDAEHTRVTRGG